MSETTVIIDFSGRTSPLEPLWPATHRCLLPLCGKALIVHLIESLARAGLRHVRMADTYPTRIARRRLGNGEEWGLKISYPDLAGKDLLSECIAANGRCIQVNGDELHAYRFDQIAWESETGRAAGATLWQVGSHGLDQRRAPGQSGWQPIDSVLALHKANQRLAAGKLDLVMPGKPFHDFGAYVDWRSEIASDAYVGRHIFVGKHALVGSRARLEESCVLSNGVVVEAECRLRNVTVMPNCRIRAGTSLSDALVTHEGVYDLSAGSTGYTVFEPSDGFLERTRDNDEQRTGLPDPLRIESSSGPGRSGREQSHEIHEL